MFSRPRLTCRVTPADRNIRGPLSAWTHTTDDDDEKNIRGGDNDQFINSIVCDDDDDDDDNIADDEREEYCDEKKKCVKSGQKAHRSSCQREGTFKHCRRRKLEELKRVVLLPDTSTASRHLSTTTASDPESLSSSVSSSSVTSSSVSSSLSSSVSSFQSSRHHSSTPTSDLASTLSAVSLCSSTSVSSVASSSVSSVYSSSVSSSSVSSFPSSIRHHSSTPSSDLSSPVSAVSLCSTSVSSVASSSVSSVSSSSVPSSSSISSSSSSVSSSSPSSTSSSSSPSLSTSSSNFFRIDTDFCKTKSTWSLTTSSVSVTARAQRCFDRSHRLVFCLLGTRDLKTLVEVLVEPLHTTTERVSETRQNQLYSVTKEEQLSSVQLGSVAECDQLHTVTERDNLRSETRRNQLHTVTKEEQLSSVQLGSVDECDQLHAVTERDNLRSETRQNQLHIVTKQIHSVSECDQLPTVTKQNQLHTVDKNNQQNAVTKQNQLHTVTEQNQLQCVTKQIQLHTATKQNHSHSVTECDQLPTVNKQNHKLRSETKQDQLPTVTKQNQLSTVTKQDQLHIVTKQNHLQSVTECDSLHTFDNGNQLHAVVKQNQLHTVSKQHHLRTVTGEKATKLRTESNGGVVEVRNLNNCVFSELCSNTRNSTFYSVCSDHTADDTSLKLNLDSIGCVHSHRQSTTTNCYTCPPALSNRSYLAQKFNTGLYVSDQQRATDHYLVGEQINTGVSVLDQRYTDHNLQPKLNTGRSTDHSLVEQKLYTGVSVLDQRYTDHNLGEQKRKTGAVSVFDEQQTTDHNLQPKLNTGRSADHSLVEQKLNTGISVLDRNLQRQKLNTGAVSVFDQPSTDHNLQPKLKTGRSADHSLVEQKLNTGVSVLDRNLQGQNLNTGAVSVFDQPSTDHNLQPKLNTGRSTDHSLVEQKLNTAAISVLNRNLQLQQQNFITGVSVLDRNLQGHKLNTGAVSVSDQQNTDHNLQSKLNTGQSTDHSVVEQKLNTAAVSVSNRNLQLQRQNFIAGVSVLDRNLQGQKLNTAAVSVDLQWQTFNTEVSILHQRSTEYNLEQKLNTAAVSVLDHRHSDFNLVHPTFHTGVSVLDQQRSTDYNLVEQNYLSVVSSVLKGNVTGEPQQVSSKEHTSNNVQTQSQRLKFYQDCVYNIPDFRNFDAPDFGVPDSAVFGVPDSDVFGVPDSVIFGIPDFDDFGVPKFDIFDRQIFGASDSDTDAQMDSVSSSDLEQVQDIQAFELNLNEVQDFRPQPENSDQQNLTAVQNHINNNNDDNDNDKINNDGDRSSSCVPSLISDISNESELVLLTEERSVMSLKEFEQLPPFQGEGEGEEEEELPPMWEDGGGLGEGVRKRGDGFAVYGRRKGQGQDQGQWAVLNDETLTLYTEAEATFVSGGENMSDDQKQQQQHASTNFEKRSELIEENLSLIYESPFAEVMGSGGDAHSPSPARKTNLHHHHHHHNNHHNHRNEKHKNNTKKKTSFQVPEDDQGSEPHHKIRISSNGNGDETCHSDDDESHDGIIDGVLSSDEDEPLSTVESPTTDASPTSPSSSSSRLNFSDAALKASLARTAQRAVSGYRSCDDADVYVGTRVKPTLILSRAPPSPSGILRKTNKKATSKSAHGTVKWASSIQPIDETT